MTRPGGAVAEEEARPAASEELRAAVLQGLCAPRKTLPCRFLYDERGSELFDRICDLDVYYQTRAETEILARNGEAIAARVGPGARIIEFGSGSARKTRLLLASLERPAAYVPIDIAAEMLERQAAALAAEFPGVEVRPVCADFTGPFDLPPAVAAPRVAFFPGSTIGNFEPEEAVRFLRRTARLCGRGGRLLIGVDLRKDRSVLEAAYDDPEGVTAAFNLNLLVRINRECGADFDPVAFDHRAVYNDSAGRIEMHLVSRERQIVRVPRDDGTLACIPFAAGEAIVTEHSYKYTIAGFRALARWGDWEAQEVWLDEAERFSVHLLGVG